MKKLTLIITIGILFSCGKNINPVKPVYVEYFKPGDVIYPDYACNDTLIVLDAIGLNKQIAFTEQGLNDYGDNEIDSVFHVYCKIKN